MLIVLDSNELIFAFGSAQETPAHRLLERILTSVPPHTIRIPQTIFEEVSRNLNPPSLHEFHKFIVTVTHIDADSLIPFDIGAKYEHMGLKTADAFIAAYTEWTHASALVSENRHFLSRRPDLPFPVLTAESAMQTLFKQDP